MYARLRLFALLILVSFDCYKTFAQDIEDTASGYGINKSVQLYTRHMGNSLHLYNGTEYVFLYPRTTGFSFFAINTFQENAIVYEGIHYHNVPLAYDLVSKQVVTKTPDNNYIQLIPEKVDSFTLNHHQFIRLTATDTGNSVVPPGFYDVTTNSAATVLIGREKVIKHAGRAEEPDHFEEYNYYFLKISNIYYAVKNSRSLLSAMPDKSNEIKTFMRKNRLNCKKDPEHTLLTAADYYAQLKK